MCSVHGDLGHRLPRHSCTLLLRFEGLHPAICAVMTESRQAHRAVKEQRSNDVSQISNARRASAKMSVIELKVERSAKQGDFMTAYGHQC